MNIVLKADQTTGKLTTGPVADILTRGNHPRGIKVRLSDGQIGRVQSLSQLGVHSSASSQPNAPSAGFGGNPFASQPAAHMTSLPTTIGDQAKARMQEDYRNDPTPAETASLEHYIKKPSQKKKKRKNSVGSRLNSTSVSEEPSESGSAQAVREETQARLEAEFPQVDTALIAAMVADHLGDIGGARKVLKEVSS